MSDLSTDVADFAAFWQNLHIKSCRQ